MTFEQFMIQWNGKYCEVAGSPGAKNQCVDLVNAYIRDVLLLPIIEWTNATDFPSRAGDKYEYIVNSPTNIPMRGDIIVWSGAIGHIAVVIEATVNTFKSFDQNYPVGSPCHVQVHNYNNIKGWLRVKQQPQIVTIPVGVSNDAQSKRQIIIDAYKAETGEFPNEDEIQARLKENLNTTQLIESLHGDGRFKKKWILPYVESLEEDLKIAKRHMEQFKKDHPDLEVKADETIEVVTTTYPKPESPKTPPKKDDTPVIEAPPILVKFTQWLKNNWPWI